MADTDFLSHAPTFLCYSRWWSRKRKETDWIRNCL